MGRRAQARRSHRLGGLCGRRAAPRDPGACRKRTPNSAWRTRATSGAATRRQRCLPISPSRRRGTWRSRGGRAKSVGAEARAKGFNVLLGGAANLIRDPRGGRNFEYFSEDPLLTGLMAGAVIDGVQSRHIISTVKHYALNAQETDRVVLDARIDPAAARESDLSPSRSPSSAGIRAA